MEEEPEEVFRKGGKQPKYKDPDIFTIEIHHGGKFMKVVGKDKYVGGEVIFADHVDGDKLSWIELVRIAKLAGHIEDDIGFFYKIKNGDFNALLNDQHVLNMVAAIPEEKIVSLYVVTEQGELLTEKHEEGKKWASEVQKEGQGGEFHGDEWQQSEDETNEDDPLDPDFIDSDYEQIGETKEVDIDDAAFEEHVDNPVEDEPEEMGYAGEISDEVENSEELHSKNECEDSEEDDAVTSKRRHVPNFRQWRRESMLKDPTFDIGMHFPNKSQFKEAVMHYTCKLKRKIWFFKNDKRRVKAVCEEGCPFVIYASRIDDSPTLVIKTMNLEHDCSVDQKIFWLNSAFLAERYAYELRADPDWSIKGFTAAVKRDFGMEPSEQQIYRARQKAAKLNQENVVDQFHKLHDYCEELKKGNPGSTVLLKTEMDGQNKRFHRLYICLEACKRGFKEGCRPVIGMDGAFIKGPHPGQLLAAVGIDGNNGMFPISYAVVEIENKDTWEWFIQNLIIDLGIENGHAYAFISDKQKGLGLALANLIPNAEHRHCVRHFYNNFKASHSGLTLKQILWDAARATTKPWWQCHMERLKIESEEGWKWLHPKPADHWSRSHFKQHYKCDILLNNLCEAFNASILKARGKPIIGMLEAIRTNLMVRMENRRVAAWKWKRSVGPRIEKIVEKNKLEAGYCSPILSGDMKYEVANMHGGQYAVDLGTKSCSCGRWQLCGIPCPHAICCIFRRKQDPYDYVHDYYKRDAYLKCYNPIISPMPSMDQWITDGPHPLLPPVFKKQVGRPRKKRIREQGEPPAPTSGNKLRRWIYDKFKCTKCGQEGHNKKTCGTSSKKQAESAQVRKRIPKLKVTRGGKMRQASSTSRVNSQPQSSAARVNSQLPGSTQPSSSQ